VNQEEFEQIFERQVQQSRDVLVTKAREYASDTDRLHNFKVAAGFQGRTAEQALWGFATKHFVSISDMVRNGGHYPAEVWDEKLGDALNYLILLRAQVFETELESAADVASPAPIDYESASSPMQVQLFRSNSSDPIKENH